MTCLVNIFRKLPVHFFLPQISFLSLGRFASPLRCLLFLFPTEVISCFSDIILCLQILLILYVMFIALLGSLMPGLVSLRPFVCLCLWARSSLLSLFFVGQMFSVLLSFAYCLASVGLPIFLRFFCSSCIVSSSVSVGLCVSLNPPVIVVL